MTITSAELVIVGCGVAGRAAARQAIDEGCAPLVLAGADRAMQLEIGDPLAGIPHRLHTARGVVEARTVILAAGASPPPGLVRELECDDLGRVVTRGRSARTSATGVYAAGALAGLRYDNTLLTMASGAQATLDAVALLASLDHYAVAA